jgi:hypothetical protein
MHPVFLISQFKKFIGDYAAETRLPAGFYFNMESVEEPEEILASREVSEAGQNVRQWLVRWKGRAMEESISLPQP